MNEMLLQPVFSTRSRTYGWGEVVLAGKLWGDWQALQREVLEGSACLNRAKATNNELASNVLQSAAKEFRYKHKLITANETEEWLKRWGLSVQEWMDYFHRSLLRQRWSGEVAETLAQYPIGLTELTRQVQIEAVCSGKFVELARRLAGRAAVGEALGERHIASESGSPETEDASAEESTDGADAISKLEAHYRNYCELVVTVKAVKGRIASHCLDWIKFYCEYVKFADEQMASEAALCVREDGMNLADVASSARHTLNEIQVYIDDAEAGLKNLLLGASKGQVLGPVTWGDEHVVLLVRDKLLPSDGDPEIRSRAEAELIRSSIQHHIGNHITWLVDLG